MEMLYSGSIRQAGDEGKNDNPQSATCSVDGKMSRREDAFSMVQANSKNTAMEERYIVLILGGPKAPPSSVVSHFPMTPLAFSAGCNGIFMHKTPIITA